MRTLENKAVECVKLGFRHSVYEGVRIAIAWEKLGFKFSQLIVEALEQQRPPVVKSFPMQPIVKAQDGVVRFQANRIVRDLLDGVVHDLNQIAVLASRGNYTDAEQMQLAQLIGYSVSGFGDLSYADRDVLRRADRKAEKL